MGSLLSTIRACRLGFCSVQLGFNLVRFGYIRVQLSSIVCLFNCLLQVQSTPVKRLCNTHNTITVNGQFPGPTLEVNNGDTLVVKVVNRARYNVTIHWHGIRQMRTAWADGPEFLTQCPIRPGVSYTYRFTMQGQEGTLWWHAHSSWLRATVYGALIIHPKEGDSYPFQKPKRETPLLLGEWWNENPIDVIREATRTGGAPNVSDAYTINGQPGDLYNCSSKAQGHIDVVNLLLDADSNLAKIARNNGKTVFHTAARMGHLEVAKSLLSKDPSIGFRTDLKGQTAVHMAVKGKNVEIMQELIKPDPSVLSLEDSKGNTTLHIATRKGCSQHSESLQRQTTSLSDYHMQ